MHHIFKIRYRLRFVNSLGVMHFYIFAGNLVTDAKTFISIDNFLLYFYFFTEKISRKQ